MSMEIDFVLLILLRADMNHPRQEKRLANRMPLHDQLHTAGSDLVDLPQTHSTIPGTTRIQFQYVKS